MPSISKIAFVAAALASVVAGADDTTGGRVLVIRTGHEPRCLNLATVASAIARHAAVVAEVGDPDSDAFEVRITGDDDHVAVVVTGRGRNDHQVLDYGSCDALADVIAADVTGAIAPERDLPPGTPAPAPASAPTSERALLLADAIRGHAPEREGLARASYITMTAVGTAYGALTLAFADDRFGVEHVLAIGGTAAVLAGGIPAIVWPASDRAEPVATVSYLLGVGAIGAANAFIGDSLDASNVEVQHDRFHESNIVFGASLAAVGLWYAADELLAPPTPERRMWEIRRKLSTPSARASVTPAELAAYESAYRNSRRSRRRYAIPLALGAATSLLLSGRETNAVEADKALTDACILGAFAAVVLVWPDPVARYRSRLRANNVDVSFVPRESGATIAMHGRF